MNVRTTLVTCAAALLCGAAFADALPDVTSETFAYPLDTLSSPRAIKTQAELDALWEATFLAGDTVTITAPDGSTGTLVSSAGMDGSTPFNLRSGGLWTLSNSEQGTVSFTVRHSIFGTLGAGTAASPAKIVDTLELMDLAAAGILGDGFVYTLRGAAELSPLIPPAYGTMSAGGDQWQLVAGGNDNAFASENTVDYSLETEQNGPDREINERFGYVIAYSGDNWRGDPSATSTLLQTNPKGVTTSQSLTGTGITPFTPPTRGDYTLTLIAGETTLNAVISVNPPWGTLILVR